MSDVNTPDFKFIFEGVPECYLILMPDAPRFTIAAVSDAYARATNTVRHEIVGKGLFEVFPDNPNDKNATGVKNLTASLNRVLAHKLIDFMAIQKYDIPRPQSTDFEERYWSPDNSPVLDEAGNVVYIVHHVCDVTAEEKLLRVYGGVRSGDTPQHRASFTDTIEKIMVEREVRMSELKIELAAFKNKA